MDAAPPAGQSDTSQPSGSRLAILTLAALGVVYGDIGTSPLYAIRECFHGEYGIEPTAANILGVLSLMFWALIVIVTVKYLIVILRADNRGEGGIIALAALVGQSAVPKRMRTVLIVLGLFGAALLYGDGMITPAISVLSAVEGIGIIAPVFDPFVLPATTTILIGLFLLQRRGTRGIGVLFGPVTLLWLFVIAALGIRSVIRAPGILVAANPWLGAEFLLRNGFIGFLVLGAVFLVVTGAEALYADLGHFGRRPIRLAWLALVLPALLCNYFGQGALLLAHPEEAHHPFYALAPRWSLAPLVLLATAATIIASQAVISGAFSLTRQAIQLGYLPRFQIIHTSPTEIGQVYIPQVNRLLMVATVALVLGFRSSSQLAAAYGVAVTSTMLITTILFFAVARYRWRWPSYAAGLPVGVFLVVDLALFGANISKILHGAWFPLAIGVIAYICLTTWRKGRSSLADRLQARSLTAPEFIELIVGHPPIRVPGKAVFMTGSLETVPPALLHNLKHNKVLHSQIAFLTIVTEEVPRISRDEKVEVTDLGHGFFRVVARYGFMEEPNVPHILALAKEKGLDFRLAETSFFLGREKLLSRRRPALPRWRLKLFDFMSRNAVTATEFYNIPPGQVVELGTQVAI
ncbi:MAG: potassium transporter Kup [Gemmatimonadota bacterium]|nr:MAG: potassium transporter Kup [Gemmatimonadota bacterium]